MHQWHYTANKKNHGQANQSSLVCEAGDTTCYFLPYHGCGPVDELKNDSSIKLLQDVEDKGGGGCQLFRMTWDGAHISLLQGNSCGFAVRCLTTRKYSNRKVIGSLHVPSHQ